MTSDAGDRVVSVRAVPGLGLDARSWAPTFAHLRHPAEVVLLPGYGLPADRATDLTPEVLAEQLLAALPAGTRPGSWVGHSSGCQVVAHVARAAPELVTSLALVGPTTDPRAPRWRDLAQRWVRTAAHEDPRQVPGLVRQYAATGPVTMARALDAARRDRIDHVLAETRCPVAVLRGRSDRICPADWATSLGHSETLAHGGHMLPFTRGEAVAGWLENLVRGGTGTACCGL